MAERGSKTLHYLDRYLGIPILRFLGLFVSKKKILPKRIRRIAVFRTAAIGDTVLLSGILQDLKIHYPSSEIVLFVGPSNFSVAPLIPSIDKYIKLPIKNIFKSFILIRKEGLFDVCIDSGQWPRLDALLAFMVKANYCIGFKSENQFKHYIFNESILHLNTNHEISNFRNLVKPLGIIENKRPSLNYKYSDNVNKLIEQTNEKYIIFHPWAGGMKSTIKEWPRENWISLCKTLLELGFDIFITGSMKDFLPSEKIIAGTNSSRVRNMAGKLSLEDTVALVSKATLLISVNTGIMHIGSAIDIPVIDLNGPTNSLRWGPLNTKSIPIDSPGQGCGFINLGFEYKNNPENCMTLITVSMVLDAINKILKRN